MLSARGMSRLALLASCCDGSCHSQGSQEPAAQDYAVVAGQSTWSGMEDVLELLNRSFYCTFFGFNIFLSIFFPGFIYLPGIFTSPLPTVDFYFHECSADPSWVDWTVHRAGHIAGFIFCEISGLFTTNNILWDRDCLFYPLPSVISIPLPFSSFYSVVNCKTKLQKTACTYSKLGWMEDLEDGRCNRTKRRKDEQLGHSHTAKCWQREE